MKREKRLEEYRDALKYHQEKVEFYQSAIELILRQDIDKNPVKKRRSKLLLDIEDIFSDGIPKTTNEIKSELENKRKIIMSSKKVSAYLFTISKRYDTIRKTGPLKNITTRSVWGLKSWFTKNELDQERIDAMVNTLEAIKKELIKKPTPFNTGRQTLTKKLSEFSETQSH